MEITINLSEMDVKYLENDLLGIDDWFQQAKKGKVNQCKKRFLREWIPKLMNCPKIKQLPASEDGVVNLAMSQPQYKNRKQREKDNPFNK